VFVFVVLPNCPIQARIQPAKNIARNRGESTNIVRLLRFFLLADFVISVPATCIVAYCHLILNI
jgi:hypothetical protein